MRSARLTRIAISWGSTSSTRVISHKRKTRSMENDYYLGEKLTVFNIVCGTSSKHRLVINPISRDFLSSSRQNTSEVCCAQTFKRLTTRAVFRHASGLPTTAGEQNCLSLLWFALMGLDIIAAVSKFYREFSKPNQKQNSLFVAKSGKSNGCRTGHYRENSGQERQRPSTA